MALAVARRQRDARQKGQKHERRPRAADWGTGNELQAAILDRLGDIEALLADMPIRGKRRKHKPPKRTLRPESGVERAERMLALEHIESVIADVEAAKVSTEEYERIAAEAAEAHARARANRGA